MTARKGNILVIFLAAGLVLSLAAAGYFFLQNQQFQQGSGIKNQESSNNTNTSFPQTQTQDETANWKTYKNNQIGFEFKYPPDFSIVESESGPSETSTGYKFRISLISNDKNPVLQIGGVTSDFSAGRGGMITDTQGYVEKKGEFYCTFVDHLQSIDKSASIRKTTNKNGVEMLRIKGTKRDIEREQYGEYSCSNPGPDQTVTLVNLTGPKYKGIALVLQNNSPYLNLQEFDQILSTFKFLESTEKQNNEELKIIYPNGGETIKLNNKTVIKFSLSKDLIKRLTSKDIVELYLLRPNGIIEGNIGEVDLNSNNFSWKPQELVHWGGLDVTLSPPDPGQYRILLIAREKVDHTGYPEWPVDIFTDGYDKFQNGKIYRDTPGDEDYTIYASDTSDSDFSIQ